MSSSNGSIFQTTVWLRAFGEELNLFYYLRGEKIVFGFLFIISKKYKVRGSFIPPYTPVYAPFHDLDLANSSELNLYRSLVRELSSRLNYKILDHICYSSKVDLLSFKWNSHFIRPSVTYQLEGKKYDLSSIHQSKRRYVKKLQKLLDCGELKLIENAEIAKIISLQEELSSIKKFNSNLRILKSICSNEELQNNFLAMAIADKDDNYLSCCWVPYDNFRAYHILNISSNHEDSLLDKANFLLTFIVVSKVLESGRTMDFEGSSIPGVEEFYRHMGGLQELRYRMTKVDVPLLKVLFRLLS